MAPKVSYAYAIKNVTFTVGTVNGSTCWNITGDLVSGEQIIAVFGHPMTHASGMTTICCLTCITS